MSGRIVFHCFVLHRPGTIKNFHTGVSAAKSAMGIPMEMVRYYLTKYFSGKTLVGAATVGDLMALEYQEGEETPFRTEDVQDFFRDRLGSIGLADLAWHFLHRNVQEDAHSSVQDARLTLMAWKEMTALKKAGVTTFSCPELEQMREERANLVGLPEGEKKRVRSEQKRKRAQMWTRQSKAHCNCRRKDMHRGGMSELCSVESVKDYHFENIFE
ncbi:uncharacterized protein LOC118436519 [Folsomia candida]|nr:uncharacterized protein LOC118436519 [Folsomia candida]